MIELHSPSDMLLTAAVALHGPPAILTPEAKLIARGLIDGVVEAARTGRFPQVDVFETLLARGEISPRITKMAQQACIAAGTVVLREVFERVCLAHVTDWTKK